MAGVLNSSVGVMNQPWFPITALDRHIYSVYNQLPGNPPAHGPANNLPVKQVQRGRQI